MRMYNFRFLPKAIYRIEQETVEAQNAVEQAIGHIIIVLDASGSMWSMLDPIKSFLIKLLVLEEYTSSRSLVSIVSYSSSGDVIRHAERVPLSKFLDLAGPAVKAIQAVTTRGLTCISQGLKVDDLIDQDETTGVILLSDGYANDPSPGVEKRSIDAAMLKLAANPKVFVNTVAFGSWADYGLLAHIANVGSGKCFQSPSPKQVYDAVHETLGLITGASAPVSRISVSPGEIVVAVSKSARKIIASTEDFTVRGLLATDDLTITRFVPDDAAGDAGDNRGNYYLLARAFMGLNRLNDAKCALFSSKNQTLLAQHGRALVSDELAGLVQALEAAIFDGDNGQEISSDLEIPGGNQLPVWEVLNVLGANSKHVMIDMDDLRSIYKRRSVKKIEGSRNEDGTITLPTTRSEVVGDKQWAHLVSFDNNRANATINMLVSQKIRVLDANGVDVATLLGMDLSDLKSNNNYTVVGDGAVLTSRLRIRLDSAQAFRALQRVGVISSSASFDLKESYEVDLGGRPVISWGQAFSPDCLDGLQGKLAGLKALASILTALTKGSSPRFTAEQIAELGKYKLTSGLNYSPSTTVPYTDRAQALASGQLDVRTTYEVQVGGTTLFDLSSIKGANEYLAKRFDLEINGAKAAKPSYGLWPTKAVVKTLTGRTKLTVADDIQFPIHCDFWGLGDGSTIKGILGDDAQEVLGTIKAALAAGKLSSEGQEALARCKQLVADKQDALFEGIRELVLYVGSTGMVPDELGATLVSLEGLKQQYPALDIPAAVEKNPEEVSIFKVGNSDLLIVSLGKADFTP